MRQAWGVPYNTHRYLIESISESIHPKVMLASRLVGFRDSLLASPKFSIRVLANLRMNDKGTLFGQTLSMIGREVLNENITPNNVKRSMSYVKMPENEAWRIGPLREVMSLNMEIPGFSKEELDDIKNYLATS